MSCSFEVFIMMVIYRRFGERNGRKCVDNVSSSSSISCFWYFTALGPGVRGSGIFFKKNCITAKGCHAAKEIMADMHTSYQCKRVKECE
jgi:hypothetical protein